MARAVRLTLKHAQASAAATQSATVGASGTASSDERLKGRREALRTDQVESEFPQFRVISTDEMTTDALMVSPVGSPRSLRMVISSIPMYGARVASTSLKALSLNH